MNKEETIIKYFSGTYAYDLFLMGMIFGNPIYSEYISNKEYLCPVAKKVITKEGKIAPSSKYCTAISSFLGSTFLSVFVFFLMSTFEVDLGVSMSTFAIFFSLCFN